MLSEQNAKTKHYYNVHSLRIQTHKLCVVQKYHINIGTEWCDAETAAAVWLIDAVSTAVHRAISICTILEIIRHTELTVERIVFGRSCTPPCHWFNQDKVLSVAVFIRHTKHCNPFCFCIECLMKLVMGVTLHQRLIGVLDRPKTIHSTIALSSLAHLL